MNNLIRLVRSDRKMRYMHAECKNNEKRK